MHCRRRFRSCLLLVRLLLARLAVSWRSTCMSLLPVAFHGVPVQAFSCTSQVHVEIGDVVLLSLGWSSSFPHEPSPTVVVVFGNHSGLLPARSALSEDPWRHPAGCQQAVCLVAHCVSQSMVPARCLLFRLVAHCRSRLARCLGPRLPSVVSSSGSLSGSRACSVYSSSTVFGFSLRLDVTFASVGVLSVVSSSFPLASSMS